jgi:hypothetical protein
MEREILAMSNPGNIKSCFDDDVIFRRMARH